MTQTSPTRRETQQRSGAPLTPITETEVRELLAVALSCLGGRAPYGEARSIAGHAVARAIHTFKPGSGTKLTTWTAICARSELAEWRRSQDWLSRHHRAEVKARGTLAPHEEAPWSLDALILNGGSLVGECLPGAEDAEQAAMDQLTLWLPVSRLPRRECQVIHWRYREGLTRKEIGARLGVSESRIVQLEEQALARLRREMEPDR